MFRLQISFAIVYLMAALGSCPALAENGAPTSAEECASLTRSLERFLGLPFREDGALNEAGQWVTFNNPDLVSEHPGFNCSGFTVAAARELLGFDFNLTEAGRDRLGDSGPGADLGEDWDFGLDLILNLAENYPHRFLPEPENMEPPPLIPMKPRRSLGWGVSLHSPEFEDLLAELQPGKFCFFTLSKPDGRFPAGVSYYHVGVIIPEPPNIWLYHTTLGANTYRVNLAVTEGLARFRRHFKPIVNGERRIFMVEVFPPSATLK